MSISLCMICGNEESVILRCLDSARPVIDELCLVRAIGTLGIDSTASRAFFWGGNNNIPVKFDDHRNSIPGLPHVDNFAAARNLSFSLATSDWILWLDCDDYLDEINCRRIRAAVATIEYDDVRGMVRDGEPVDGLFATYKVATGGAEILRERLIRRGKGHWRGAVHETCIIDGEVLNCPQIVVFHGEHSHKDLSSAQRNVAILRESLADSGRQYFYFHNDLKLTGDKAGALQAAHAALLLLDPIQLEERYMVLLNLSELEPENTVHWLLTAAGIQPHRRESFAYLCQKALIDGRVSDAISWFRIMDALPAPSPLPWTHQGIWYGWARNHLRVRVLRASGQTAAAQEEHARHLSDPDYAKGVSEYESRPN